MNSAERLAESKHFWQQSAEYEKRQLKMSIAIGSSGLVLAGVGIGLAISGHPAEGTLAVVSGGSITYFGAKEAVEDFQDYKTINETIAVREGMSRGMSMASSREH